MNHTQNALAKQLLGALRTQLGCTTSPRRITQAIYDTRKQRLNECLQAALDTLLREHSAQLTQLLTPAANCRRSRAAINLLMAARQVNPPMAALIERVYTILAQLDAIKMTVDSTVDYVELTYETASPSSQIEYEWG